MGVVTERFLLKPEMSEQVLILFIMVEVSNNVIEMHILAPNLNCCHWPTVAIKLEKL